MRFYLKKKREKHILLRVSFIDCLPTAAQVSTPRCQPYSGWGNKGPVNIARIWKVTLLFGHPPSIALSLPLSNSPLFFSLSLSCFLSLFLCLSPPLHFSPSISLLLSLSLYFSLSSSTSLPLYISVPLSLSLYLSPSMSLSPPLYLSPYISLPLSLFLYFSPLYNLFLYLSPLYISLPLYLYLYFSLSLPVSLSPSISLSLYLFPSISLPLFLSLSFCISLPFYIYLPLSFQALWLKPIDGRWWDIFKEDDWCWEAEGAEKCWRGRSTFFSVVLYCSPSSHQTILNQKAAFL